MASDQQQQKVKRDFRWDEQKVVPKVTTRFEQVGVQGQSTIPPMVHEEVHIRVTDPPTGLGGRMGKTRHEGQGEGNEGGTDKDERAKSWQQENMVRGKSEGRSMVERSREKIQEEKGKIAVQEQGKTGEDKSSSSQSVGKFEVTVKEIGDLPYHSSRKSGEEGRKREVQSLEEITRARQSTQQNSVDSIREAEERYAKAKEHAASAVHNTKESAVNLGSAAATYAAHLGVEAKDQTIEGAKSTTQFVAEKSGPVKDTVVDSALTGYTTVRDTTAEYGKKAKDTTVEYGKKAKDTTAEYAVKAKDKTAEYVIPVKDTTVEYATRAKDTTVEATKGAVGYVGEKIVGVKDTTAEYAVKAKDTTVDYAVKAKDTTIEATKEAAGYVGEKVVGAKDVTVEATKGAAGYIGEKAVAAKDVAVDTAVAAKDVAVDTAVAAKDVTVGTVVGAKDMAVDTAVAGKDVTLNTAVGAKNMAVNTAVGAKDMTVDTAALAKDVAVETGKKGLGVADRVTGEAKVMGWGATEYVGEKATEAVKGLAGAVKGVAGYAGDTAVAAKDVAVDVTAKVGGYVEEKAVGAGETVKEYSERKKMEAEKELQRKKEGDQRGQLEMEDEEGRTQGKRVTLTQVHHGMGTTTTTKQTDLKNSEKTKQSEVNRGIDYEI